MRKSNSYTVIAYFPERTKGGHKGVFKRKTNLTLEEVHDLQKTCKEDLTPVFMWTVYYFKSDDIHKALDRDHIDGLSAHSKTW